MHQLMLNLADLISNDACYSCDLHHNMVLHFVLRQLQPVAPWLIVGEALFAEQSA